jgi:RNA polymerase sigma-70 factor (ECF subfamily)
MEITDNGLTEMLIRRDPAGLEQIMEKYGAHVLGLATRILQGICEKEDIEECVSDAFIACWHRIGEYDPSKGSLKTWLLILTKYKALDYRRKMTRNTSPNSEVVEHVANYLDTEQIVLRKEEKEELQQLIELLEPLDRAVFYKRYFYYESLETIAQSLGLSRKAVESRLGRSRKWLREKMGLNRKEGMS